MIKLLHFIKKNHVLCIFLCLGIFSAQALFFGPLLDDQTWITRTPENAGSSGWLSVVMNFPFGAEYWRPLPTAYFALIASLFSEHTTFIIFKSIHFLLFILTIHTIYRFFYLLLREQFSTEKAQKYALFIATFSTLHPATSEVGAWISSLFDVLVSLFSFLGSTFLFQALKTASSSKPKKILLPLMLTSYLCALLSKENSIVLIFTQIALIFFFIKHQIPLSDFIKKTLPILFLILAWIGLRFYLKQQKQHVYPDINLSFFEHVRLSFNTLSAQLVDIIFPFVNTGTIREWDTPIPLITLSGIVFAFILLLSGSLTIHFYKKYPELLIACVSLLCSIILLIPTSGIILNPMVRMGWLYSDRFLFHSLPFLALCLLLFYQTLLITTNYVKIIQLFLYVFFSISIIFTCSVWQQYASHFKLVFTLSSNGSRTGEKFLAHEYSNLHNFEKADILYKQALSSPPNNVHLKNELYKHYLSHLIKTEQWEQINSIVPLIITHDEKFKPQAPEMLAYQSLLRLSQYKTGRLDTSIENQKNTVNQYSQAFDLIILIDLLIKNDKIDQAQEYIKYLRLNSNSQKNALASSIQIEKSKLLEKLRNHTIKRSSKPE